jgi:hypothetical protein
MLHFRIIDMNGTNSKINNQNWLNFILLKAVSFLSLAYFAAIPLGWVKTKFDIPDVVVLFIILLFNSELLEKLVKLGISKEGITLDLNQIITEQDSQKASIATNTANIEAITNIVQRITLLEQQMAQNESQKENLVNSLLSDYELMHLEKLASDQAFMFKKQRDFEQELRHLRAFGFIGNLPGKTISKMPETGNLKDYLQITERGREYLLKRKQTETINN